MRLEDLTGMRFGKWTVLKRAPTKSDHATRWLCKCDCGTIKDIAAATLKNGESKSCGCYRKESASKHQVENLRGYKFGLLTVIDLAYVAKNRQCVWKCMCDCGTYTNVYASNLKRGHTLSCGCIGTSVGENEVAKILRNMHVNFDREYSFEDLISPNGGKLYFDFGIKDAEQNIIGLIEYQGIQHEKAMPNAPYFGQFQREYSDQAKRNYCAEKNIPLAEIWYNEPIINATRAALQKIYGHANSVPRLQ